MIALLVALCALGADEPVWHATTRLAVAGFPSGAMWDTRLQLRAPLYRSASIVFRDTFAGAGIRIAATPAFTEVGPRISIAPLDVFDVDLSAAWTGYYGRGGIGLLPFDEPAGKLESLRSARGEESVTGGALSLTVAPTVKAKVGPVIALHGWTISYLAITPGAKHDAPFTYEPFRDLVVAWTDVTMEHQTALLFEALPGGDRPMLRVGATARDRFALESKDRSTTVGALVMTKPGTGAAVPTIVGQALWYVRDADRVGPIPSMAAMVQWTLESRP